MVEGRATVPTPHGRKPTSVDVAREAGVAQSTVSYVLTGRRSISPSTRRRVEEAIDRLGFVPNSGARTLAGNRSQIIGLVVPFHPELDMEVNMAFVGAIAEAARERDHDVLLVTTDEGPAGLQRLRGSGLCDALILMDVEEHDPRLPVARELGVPTVVIGVPAESAGLTCVDLDFEGAGRLAVSTLAARGHAQIGVVSPSNGGVRRDMTFARRFLRGVQEAAEEAGVRVACVEARASFDSLAAALDEVGAELAECSALVVHHSAALEPLLSVLRMRGGDRRAGVDIVGVCSPAVAEHVGAEVDVIVLQPQVVSRRAMDILFSELEGEAVQHDGAVHLVPAVVVPCHASSPEPHET